MNIKRLSAILLTVMAMYCNIQFFNIQLIGWVLLPVYFLSVSKGFELLLIKFFYFNNSYRLKVYGIFISFILISWFVGILIIFWQFSVLFLSIILLVIGGLSIFLEKYIINIKNTKIQYDEKDDKYIQILHKKIYIIAFLVSFSFGLYLLYAGRVSSVVITPWQTIYSNFIYLFFITVFITGCFIFSFLKVRYVLMFLILQFLLLFAYLPLSQQLFYGADGWRHIASIKSVISNNEILIENFTDNLNWLEKINPGLLSYSQFWGSFVFLSNSLSIDLISLMTWFQPVLATVFLPLLLYELGLSLGWRNRQSLILPWLALWPFALQSVGGFSLPVNFGFLIFLLLIILILKRSAVPRKEQIWILCILGCLSLFGYAVYFILFWFAFGLIEILKQVKKKPLKLKYLTLGLLIVVSILLIPTIELVAGYAKFDSSINVVESTKQFIGNFSATYIATGPRTHIISTGNIFFNQAPLYAFIPNQFTLWRLWMPLFMVIIFICFVIGLYFLWKQKYFISKWLPILIIGIYSGYIISRYFLSGEHLLSRRLEPILALFGIIMLGVVIKNLFAKNKMISIILILIMSIAISTSYSLGPTTRSMSSREYNTVLNIWEQMDHNAPACVIGNTFTLLALEAISSKKIVGGGFPIDKNFGQKELLQLFEKIKNNPTLELKEDAKKLTGADVCYLIMDEDINEEDFTDSILIF